MDMDHLKLLDSVANFLDGSDVVDVDATLDDYMTNIVDAEDPEPSDEERAWIEGEIREILEYMAAYGRPPPAG